MRNEAVIVGIEVNTRLGELLDHGISARKPISRNLLVRQYIHDPLTN